MLAIDGVPLVELDVELFSLPITAYATSYFLTARTAARRMVAHKSGVNMTVTALPSRTGTPLIGGYGPAQAAKEALTRELSAELAPQGIRVVGLRPHGMPPAGLAQPAHFKEQPCPLPFSDFLRSTFPLQAPATMRHPTWRSASKSA